MRSRLLLALALVSTLVVIALLAVAWVFSSRILVPAPYGLMPEFEIVTAREAGPTDDARAPAGPATAGPNEARSVADVEVLLPPEPPEPAQFARTEVGGRYGLRWPDGTGRLGPVLGREADAVVRPLRVTRGEPPTAGDPARLDVTLYGPDPSARGLAYEDVAIPGPLGAVPAWWLPGRPEEAILVLHGRRRADRTEALRILPTLAASGASVLVSSYRNHDGSPGSPDGFYHYGATEAEDALAAVDWLAEGGAKRILLVGFSMGGAVAIEALEDWPEAPSAGRAETVAPAGLMLDSPLLDPAVVFRDAAEDMGLPAPALITGLAMSVASIRAGVDWGELDARESARDLDLPVLLVGGTADETVPVGLLDDFARALPREPVYLRLEGVEHVEAWNAAPLRYEEAVAAFLDATGFGATPAP